VKHLLDVNVLLALAWTHHPDHHLAHQWAVGRSFAVCPLSELGFLRLSNQPKAFNVPMEVARAALAKLIEDGPMDRIPDDLPGLESKATSHSQITDHYLADLARKHNLRLATLDRRIKHESADVVD
jgi:uncharacterized protein